ncbi:carboxy terminal-processing peptidase [Ferrimonas lipolytica]|uniref:Carboxy terminal-processing peptidase n=1 Tax=Ferrimonas lipolytica TaxID=2724191 RepID=A0A6H1UBU1_9GAMM|nr:carboxy terminal-processing peptidase [Ferrimonas lipolytica]QIZ76557.1 carboxy terminal-processing peptidase [Ferrimonas lipolytica]
MIKNKITMLLAGLVLSAQAVAVSPAIPLQDMPELSQEAQHMIGSKRVNDLFTRSHYRKVELNAEFAGQVYQRYLKQLDMNRSNLLQSDIDGFKGLEAGLLREIQAGKLSQAYDLYELSISRRYQRLEYALSLLDEPMKFDVEGDRYDYDRTEQSWATTTAQLDEIWRQRVKNDALSLAMTGKEWPEISEMLTKRYNNAIKRLSQTQSEDVFQSVMNAFAYTLEPHTRYLSPRNAERFKTEMNLSLEGIGAVLMMTDDYTVVRELVTGGPADKQGELKPDDKIIGVAQEGEKVVDVIGWRLDDVVELIKGKKDSTVTLQILAAKDGNNGLPKEIEIVRDEVRLEDRAVKSEVREVPSSAGTRTIGVIDIPSFYMDVSGDVAKEIAKLTEQNVEGIVVDLRNNGGGSLSEASLLTGLFIPQGPVVQIRDQRNKITENGDRDARVAYDGELTVLVNRYSASASEIFAAALQDYGRAVVIGEQTFGKGTVQQHRPLGRIYDMYDKPLGNVTYTISKFYRINGGSTQLKGVIPDLSFPSFVKEGEYGESQEDNALPWDSVPSARYRTFGDIDAEMLNYLDSRHQARIGDEYEFSLLREDIARYRLDKDKKWVSLVKAEREAEQQADDDRALARMNERLKQQGLEPVTDLADAEDIELPDYQLDEAAAITVDVIDYGLTARLKNAS